MRNRRVATGVVIAAMLVGAACTAASDSAVGPATDTTATTTETTTSTTATTIETTTSTAEPTTTETTAPPRSTETVTVLAVGDLTDCRGRDAEVAELLRSLEGTILMPGDLAYDAGSRQQFEDCFLPLYESELDRIYAVPGDVEYRTPGAEPFFEVTAGRSGEPGKGWYAADLGAWQLIALNSNCSDVGGCREDSEQYQWLDDLLKQERIECRIVMWHEPRFTSSANYSGIAQLGDFYGRVHGSGGDIVIVGNSHHYERLGPLAPNGDPDDDGMVNFTVGVGGRFLSGFGEPLPGSQIRSDQHFGVLRLTLRPDGYDWEFINVESNPTELVDTGSGTC